MVTDNLDVMSSPFLGESRPRLDGVPEIGRAYSSPVAGGLQDSTHLRCEKGVERREGCGKVEVCGTRCPD